MDERSKDLAKSILKRAMMENRQNAVRRIQERLNAARDVPQEHKRILLEIQLFGKALPQSPWQSMTMH